MPLDRALAKIFNKQPFQYYMSPKQLFPNGISYALFDDTVLTIKQNPAIAQKIHDWFHTHISFSDAAQKELQYIVHTKSSHIVLIQKNKALSQKLRKMLEKYFAI